MADDATRPNAEKPAQTPAEPDRPYQQELEHLRKQTEQLELQTEQLQQQSDFLHAIKGHFLPETETAREKRWRKFLLSLTMKLVAAITALLAIQQLSAWMVDQWQIKRMAERYAEVAKAIYYDENNPDVALTFLNHAIELQENNAEYRFMRGYIDGMAVVRNLLNLDRPLTKAELDQAHQALAQALFLKSLSDRRPEPYILQGQVHVALKMYDQALGDLNHAIALDPQSDFAHLRLGTLLVEQGKLEPGLAEIKQALALNPRSKWAWLWQGIITADKLKDPAAARQSYAKALALDPRFDMALYNYAWTWISGDKKDYKEAQKMMVRALAVNPAYKEAYYGMGMIYGYQNRYDIACVYMGKAIALDDQFMTAWKWRGIMQGEQGKHDEALKDFDKTIELDPQKAELYVRRAKSYENLGRLNEAINDLRFSLELDGANEKTLVYLGNVFMKAGEKPKALEYYDKALGLNGRYNEAYAQKAAVYAAMDQPQKGIEALGRALKFTSYRPERFLLQRGLLYRVLKNFKNALTDIRQARQGDPTLAEAWFAEAEVLKESGRIAEARVAINRFIELRPQDGPAYKLRAALQ